MAFLAGTMLVTMGWRRRVTTTSGGGARAGGSGGAATAMLWKGSALVLPSLVHRLRVRVTGGDGDGGRYGWSEGGRGGGNE